MSYVEGSTGAMLQGVSQQPARLRVDGQVTEQINYDPDVLSGMTSRPGTDLVGYLDGASGNLVYREVTTGGVTYIVGYAVGVIKVWSLDGVPVPVTSASTAYMGTDMVFHSDVNTGALVCLNRTTVTKKDAAIVGRPFHAALVTSLGGLFDHTYIVDVYDGTTLLQTATYVTPDGTTTGDAAKTTAEFIIKALHDALVALAPIAGMTYDLFGPTLSIGYTSALHVISRDSADGDTLRVAGDTADDTAALPKSARNGHIVRITGGPRPEDDYYLTFVSDVTAAVGTGLGNPGTWVETSDPDAANDLDLTTMPHRLTVAGGAAVFEQVAWLPRRAGDAVTNPDPVFIDTAIRDMSTFEDRLAMLAKGSLRTSRSDDSLDLWRRSATVESAADPIEVKSNTSGANLDWIIQFDRDLLLVSDPGAAQFVVTGGGVTPQNASMVLTTEYEVLSGVRPINTGRTIILPYKEGTFTGVNEFFTESTANRNTADPLTSVQNKYIIGNVTSMASAENFSRFVLTTDGDSNTVWSYRYLWEQGELLQSAWFKLHFRSTVRYVFFGSSDMHVILADENDDDALMLVRMDMNRLDSDVGFHITLDRKDDFVVTGGSITTTVADARLVQRAGCLSPGLLTESVVVDNGDGTYTHTPVAINCPEGSTVTAGQVVTRTLVPTMPQPKDFQGNVVSAGKLTVSAFLLHMESSGSVTAQFDSPYKPTRRTTDHRFPLDDEPLDGARLGVSDYILRVPWRERTNRSTLTVYSDDVRPDTILEIEWEGDQRGIRRRI